MDTLEFTQVLCLGLSRKSKSPRFKRGVISPPTVLRSNDLTDFVAGQEPTKIEEVTGAGRPETGRYDNQRGDRNDPESGEISFRIALVPQC